MPNSFQPTEEESGPDPVIKEKSEKENIPLIKPEDNKDIQSSEGKSAQVSSRKYEGYNNSSNQHMEEIGLSSRVIYRTRQSIERQGQE